MSNPALLKILQLSTAHLTKPTRTQLDDWCASIDLTRRQRNYSADPTPPTLMAATEYGWFVYATEDQTDLPPDLAACIVHARFIGADYLLFDADVGDDCEVLPTYDEDTGEIIPATASAPA